LVMSEHSKAIAPVEGQALAPVIEKILDANPTPEVLQDVIRLHREMQETEAKRLFTAALVALKRDLPSVIGRDQRVKFGNTNYTHTSLGAAVAEVTPILSAYDFSHSWTTNNDDPRRVDVTCTLTHCGGHSESTSLGAPPDDTGNKNAGQKVASTVTLLQRYTLLAILGIATADMREDHRSQPADPNSVDTARNLKAATSIRSKRGEAGIKDAEAIIDKPINEATAADLGRLREWMAKEPGSEDA